MSHNLKYLAGCFHLLNFKITLIYLYVCAHACALVWQSEDSHGSWFSPSTMWAPGRMFRIPGLEAGAFTSGAISVARGLKSFILFSPREGIIGAG